MFEDGGNLNDFSGYAGGGDTNYGEPLNAEDLDRMFKESERRKAEKVYQETEDMYKRD